MKLRVKRIAFKDTYTIGRFYIDDVYVCDSLEDMVRPNGIKIYGETAIPTGVYNVILNLSNRFKTILPLLLDVPMFEGIRIHGGNTSEDTHGCILLGKNTEVGKLTQSQIHLKMVLQKLKLSPTPITIEIS
jgi:hypothetical protein